MNAAELYDELQELFGIGDWSPSSDKQWYQARMIEIGKLKRLLRSRRLSIEDVHLAARYAHEGQYPIVATWQLLFLIPDARAAARAATQEAEGNPVETALHEAFDLGLGEWADRLMRVDRRDKAAVEVVLKEYQDR